MSGVQLIIMLNAAYAYLLIRGADEGIFPFVSLTIAVSHCSCEGAIPVAASASVDGSSFSDVNVDKVFFLCSSFQHYFTSHARFPAWLWLCARYVSGILCYGGHLNPIKVLPSTCDLTATSCCFVPKAGALCLAVCDISGRDGALSCAVMLRTRLRYVAGNCLF